MNDDLSSVAERIEWNEELFSAGLVEALKAHQFDRAQAFVHTFNRHARQRTDGYSPVHANLDLDRLRASRQFTLMRQYAEAALGSGTMDLKVRRQYGQALIELGAFDEAREVLESVVRDRAKNPSEGMEARGLIGRSYKQQYVDDPTAPSAADRLQRAIEVYRKAYDEDPTLLWHGINAVSCSRRAIRDQILAEDASRNAEIAAAILKSIEKARGETNGLNLWDSATCVEALLALARIEEASTALDEYLSHPALDAFAVSSTYRQFDQVLQLQDDGDPLARSMLDRLREVVERYRGGGAFRQLEQGRDTVSVLVRVSDPAWEPSASEPLVIHGRIGTVLSAECTREMLSALLRAPGVISLEESRAAPASAECNVSLPCIKVASTYQGAAGPFAETGEGALIAIIDNGIDVLHAAFLDETKQRSRIVGVWDQNDATGPAPAGFKRGTYHSAEAIAGYLQARRVPLRLGRNPGGHGTHVASIAAGRAAGQFFGGVAPAASLLVVIADRSESIGYSSAHVEALSFIDQEATRLGLPVVVNVSQGMNGGPHDGNSVLELGFENFSAGGRRPGRVIVKSAGNERAKKSHASVEVGPNSQARLPWQQPGDAGSRYERVELWWSSANEVEFRLGDPFNVWSNWVKKDNRIEKGVLAETPFAMQLTKRHVDNGDDHLLITLGGGDAVIASGTWVLEMRSLGVPDPGKIHAWIERGSSFLDHIDPEMTLSIPGTAPSAITVGAVNPKSPTEIGSFSSFGPTRDGRRKPEVSAPGIGIWAADGGTEGGIINGDGTSMAAPHAAGAIALVLSRAAKTGSAIPTANQLSKALLQNTAIYNPKWDPGMGYGVIDVAKFLTAF